MLLGRMAPVVRACPAVLRAALASAPQTTELAEDEARAIEYTIENDLTSFGKGFTVLEQVLTRTPTI